MKVIRRGKIKQDKPKRINCRTCGSKLEYTKSDIQYDWREDDSYIECPVCKEKGKNSFISVK